MGAGVPLALPLPLCKRMILGLPVTVTCRSGLVMGGAGQGAAWLDCESRQAWPDAQEGQRFSHAHVSGAAYAGCGMCHLADTWV